MEFRMVWDNPWCMPWRVPWYISWKTDPQAHPMTRPIMYNTGVCHGVYPATYHGTTGPLEYTLALGGRTP